MAVVTRFAPSPTGYLHLGSAYSALFAHAAAKRADGRFIVRVEDTDLGRCRPEFEAQTFEDLTWLGLAWEMPVLRQSEHLDVYEAVIQRLRDLGVLYPCFCTRKEIMAEIEASGLAPHGPGGPVYPGICRGLPKDEQEARMNRGDGYVERLDVAKALALTGPLSWADLDKGEVAARPERFGDVVIRRKDEWPSYHLAVTWDDHVQGITLITRGEDLFDATDVHRLLQALLGLATPAYHHHRLLLDKNGRRLAKRDKDVTIMDLRAAGKTAAEVKNLCGWTQDD